MTRLEIERYILSIQPAGRRSTPLSDHNTVERPKAIVAPIRSLRVDYGFSCVLPGCGYCAKNIRQISVHSHKHHPDVMDHRAASIQRFFNTTKSPYFEVSQPVPSLALRAPLPIETIQYLERVMAANKKAEMEADDALYTVSEYIGAKQQSAWLTNTGFQLHLTGIDTRSLIVKTIIPDKYWLKSLPVETAIVKHLTSIFDRIRGATAGVPQVILEMLASDDINKTGRKPFSPVQETATWNRYTSYWHRFFIYLFSTNTSINEGSCPRAHQKILNHCLTKSIRSDLDKILTLLKAPEQQTEEETEEDVEGLMEDFMVTILKQRCDYCPRIVHCVPANSSG